MTSQPGKKGSVAVRAYAKLVIVRSGMERIVKYIGKA